jgi:hypothetical protein
MKPNMSEKHVFEYAVIRIVPKVEREEFLNAGVILFSKQKKFLQMLYRVDEKRLNLFAEDLDIAEIKDYLHAWELICQGGKGAGGFADKDLPSRFRWLTATRSTIIQSSKVHPGLCADPEAKLQDLFEKYVR